MNKISEHDYAIIMSKVRDVGAYTQASYTLPANGNGKKRYWALLGGQLCTGIEGEPDTQDQLTINTLRLAPPDVIEFFYALGIMPERSTFSWWRFLGMTISMLCSGITVILTLTGAYTLFWKAVELGLIR